MTVEATRRARIRHPCPVSGYGVDSGRGLAPRWRRGAGFPLPREWYGGRDWIAAVAAMTVVRYGAGPLEWFDGLTTSGLCGAPPLRRQGSIPPPARETRVLPGDGWTRWRKVLDSSTALRSAQNDSPLPSASPAYVTPAKAGVYPPAPPSLWQGAQPVGVFSLKEHLCKLSACRGESHAEFDKLVAWVT